MKNKWYKIKSNSSQHQNSLLQNLKLLRLHLLQLSASLFQSRPNNKQSSLGIISSMVHYQQIILYNTFMIIKDQITPHSTKSAQQIDKSKACGTDWRNKLGRVRSLLVMH